MINEPSALAFADKLPPPKAEDAMTSEQNYWYNKGHEDGRRLVPVKELTDEEINSVWHKDLWKSKTPHLDFARAIIKEVRGR